VTRHADAAVQAGAGITRGDAIAAFYGSYFLTVNIATLLMQLVLVTRILQRIGVRGALYVLPLVVLTGYGLIAFLPIFSIIRIVKVIENATDYSLMNTTRHALYLPMPSGRTCKGKTTVEGFFWRLGDLLQAGAIRVGLHVLELRVEHFALLNMALALAWLRIATGLGAHYERAARR
jgi:AAA family ATP:ADP antiporter